MIWTTVIFVLLGFALWRLFTVQHHVEEIIVPIASQPAEPIERGEIRKCLALSRFLADSGNVCPLEVHAAAYTILPFSQTSASVRQQTVDALQKEWADDAQPFTEAFIRKTWPDIDVLYVAATPDEQFLACMAVDRRNFYPFISNLLVAPAYRSRGYAGRMLDLGEQYARESLGFDCAKLWCNDGLKGYYTKRGWTVDGQTDDGTWIMMKKLK
jgi:GNAT superfamily N-acetyltransferase